MKRSIQVIIILASFIPFYVSAKSEIGIIKTVTGHVSIQRDHLVIPAEIGTQIENKDSLLTKKRSTAGIIFTDGTTFTIGPNSQFDMQNYRFEPATKAYDFSVHLKKGSAIYNSGKIGKLSPSAVDIATPRGTVGIRGTRLIIKVE